MIITVPTIIENGTRRADAPDPHTLVEDMGDTMRVRVESTPEIERWAVEQGYHVPDHVDPGHLMVALLNFDEALFDAIEAAIESDKQVRAAMRASFVSRHSLMLAGFCQQFGVTEEQKNALFVAAYLLRL